MFALILPMLTSTAGKYALVALGALLLVGGGVLYLEHRGAAQQAASDQARDAAAAAAQATEAANENAAALAATQAHDAAAGAAIVAVDNADAATAATVTTLTKGLNDAPDATAPVDDSMQHLLDGLRDPATGAPSDRH